MMKQTAVTSLDPVITSTIACLSIYALDKLQLLAGHFIKYTLLEPRWPHFCLQTFLSNMPGLLPLQQAWPG